MCQGDISLQRNHKRNHLVGPWLGVFWFVQKMWHCGPCKPHTKVASAMVAIGKMAHDWQATPFTSSIMHLRYGGHTMGSNRPSANPAGAEASWNVCQPVLVGSLFHPCWMGGTHSMGGAAPTMMAGGRLDSPMWPPYESLVLSSLSATLELCFQFPMYPTHTLVILCYHC